MWWTVGILVVPVALSIVAAVRRRRNSNEDGNAQLGHTEQSMSIGNVGSHL
jgi:hypothetical protein